MATTTQPSTIIGRYEVRHATDAEATPGRPWELWDTEADDFVEAFHTGSAAIKEAQSRWAECLREALAEQVAGIKSLDKLEALKTFLETL